MESEETVRGDDARHLYRLGASFDDLVHRHQQDVNFLCQESAHLFRQISHLTLLQDRWQMPPLPREPSGRNGFLMGGATARRDGIDANSLSHNSQDVRESNSARLSSDVAEEYEPIPSVPKECTDFAALASDWMKPGASGSTDYETTDAVRRWMQEEAYSTLPRETTDSTTCTQHILDPSDSTIHLAQKLGEPQRAVEPTYADPSTKALTEAAEGEPQHVDAPIYPDRRSTDVAAHASGTAEYPDAGGDVHKQAEAEVKFTESSLYAGKDEGTAAFQRFRSRSSSATVSTIAGTAGHSKKFFMRNPWAEHRNMEFLKLSPDYLQEKQRHKSVNRMHIPNFHHMPRYSRSASSGDVSQSIHAAMVGLTSIDCLVIHPDSPKRLLWCICSAIFVGYDCIMIPVDLSFNVDPSLAVLMISCIFWTLDILVNFFTGIATGSGPIMKVPKIAARYARTWLIIDVIIVAQDWLSIIFWRAAGDDGTAGLTRSTQWGMRLMRGLRLIRLVRMVKMKNTVREVAFRLRLSFQRIEMSRGFWIMTLVLLVIVHLTACIWHLVGMELQEGWVQENQLKEASVGRRYIFSLHYACSRLVGMRSSVHVSTSVELWIDVVFIWLFLIFVNVYAGQALAVILALNTSRQYRLVSLALQYSRVNKISRNLDKRLMTAVQTASVGGAGEISSDEANLLKQLPVSIQEDLLYEARTPWMRRKQVFDDMHRANPRVIRHICNEAMLTILAVQSELVFCVGDSCQRMLFNRSGYLTYEPKVTDAKKDLTMENSVPRSISMKTGDAPSMNFSSRGSLEISVSSTTSLGGAAKKQLERGCSLSEAVLWTSWENCGRLLAVSECILIALHAVKFGAVIVEHSEACVHAVKYAKQYVRNLNRWPSSELSDILEFEYLDVHTLNETVYTGNMSDHFMFLSHYKVESGTEATLMRDLLEPILREDEDNIANELVAPIFVDSEDLDDLARLKAHVKGSLNLILLLTPGLFSRPWCLLEIVTAIHTGVNIVPVEVQRPGVRYEYPTEEFYENIRNGQYLAEQSVLVLEEQSITLQDVEYSLRQVFKKISCPFSPHKSKSVRNAELMDIIKRCVDHREVPQSDADITTKVGLLETAFSTWVGTMQNGREPESPKSPDQPQEIGRGLLSDSL